MSNTAIRVCPAGLVNEPASVIRDAVIVARTFASKDVVSPVHFKVALLPMTLKQTDTMFPSYVRKYHIVDVLSLVSLILTSLLLLGYILFPQRSQPKSHSASPSESSLLRNVSQCFKTIVSLFATQT